MRVLKRILLGLVAITVILAVISPFLPKGVNVQRSITMRGEASNVFAYVNSLKKFHEWSPWTLRDPDLAPEFSGPEEGVGATMSWTSDVPGVGTGSQEIVESRRDEYVKVTLDFGDGGNGIADFRILSEDNRTRIVWGFRTDLGYNPIARYMGLMIDTWVGDEYDIGLARLKSLVETGSVATGG